MHCDKCGAELDPVEKSCRKCGAIVSEDGVSHPINGDGKNTTGSKLKRRLKQILIMTGALIGFMIAFSVIMSVIAVFAIEYTRIFKRICLILVLSVIVFSVYKLYKYAEKYNDEVRHRQIEEKMKLAIRIWYEENVTVRKEQQEKLKEQYDNGDTNIAYDVTPDGAKFYYDIRERESEQSEGEQ
ncbi:MAG: hypothetical protein HDT33_03680 [Clostridiales bacterium]|nr:hypothetical protein [Clostridiales bacterium]